jgi:hypothetical protein
VCELLLGGVLYVLIAVMMCFVNLDSRESDWNQILIPTVGIRLLFLPSFAPGRLIVSLRRLLAIYKKDLEAISKSSLDY